MALLRGVSVLFKDAQFVISPDWDSNQPSLLTQLAQSTTQSGPSPDTSLPGSWRDTCRSLRCWHGDQWAGSQRRTVLRHGATQSGRTESAKLWSAETPDRPEPSSVPPETQSFQSEHDGNFPVRRGRREEEETGDCRTRMGSSLQTRLGFKRFDSQWWRLRNAPYIRIKS